MKRLVNPYIGLEGYDCFGCSPHNPHGVHMHFYEDEATGDIVSLWQPTQHHQGWIDILHGGVQCVLLDEICGWVVFRKLQSAGVTVKMETRYKRSVSTRGGSVQLRARIKEQRRSLVTIEAEIFDSEGNLCTLCTCQYLVYGRERSARDFHFRPCLAEGEEIRFSEQMPLEKK